MALATARTLKRSCQLSKVKGGFFNAVVPNWSMVDFRSFHDRASQTLRRDEMAKAWAGILVVAAVVASFLLAAPVIESATSGSTQVFQAVGTADSGSD